MKTKDDAQSLADMLVKVGNQLGTKTIAELSDMNQPLGKMIGNAVEIDESVNVLSGQGPPDVREPVASTREPIVGCSWGRVAR